MSINRTAKKQLSEPCPSPQIGPRSISTLIDHLLRSVSCGEPILEWAELGHRWKEGKGGARIPAESTTLTLTCYSAGVIAQYNVRADHDDPFFGWGVTSDWECNSAAPIEIEREYPEETDPLLRLSYGAFSQQLTGGELDFSSIAAALWLPELERATTLPDDLAKNSACDKGKLKNLIAIQTRDTPVKGEDRKTRYYAIDRRGIDDTIGSREAAFIKTGCLGPLEKLLASKGEKPKLGVRLDFDAALFAPHVYLRFPHQTSLFDELAYAPVGTLDSFPHHLFGDPGDQDYLSGMLWLDFQGDLSRIAPESLKPAYQHRHDLNNQLYGTRQQHPFVEELHRNAWPIAISTTLALAIQREHAHLTAVYDSLKPRIDEFLHHARRKQANLKVVK